MTKQRWPFQATIEDKALINRINVAREFEDDSVAGAIRYSLRFTCENDKEISPIHAREFRGFDQSIIGGDCTDEELEIARLAGSVNAFRMGLFEVKDEIAARLPVGWNVSTGTGTHKYALQAPEIPAAATDPILLGFVRVHHGDPHYPIWLWKHR